LFDPYLTCIPSFLLSQTAWRDQFDSGSGLANQLGKPTNASGLQYCLRQLLFASTSSSL
jgi:hypothetical protein